MIQVYKILGFKTINKEYKNAKHNNFINPFLWKDNFNERQSTFAA